MPEENGPFLQAALICEKVLQEADGTASAIRIIDRTFVTAGPGQQAPVTMPSIPLSHTLFISFKSGDVRGRKTIRIVFRNPVGMKVQEITVPVLLEGEDRGANIIAPYNLMADQEGVHWFEVFYEDRLMSKIPLRVIYQAPTATRPPQL